MTLKELIHKNYITYTRFKKNKYIFKDIDDFVGLYFIEEGRVKVVSKNNSSKVFLWYVSKGELLGLSTIFDNADKYKFCAIADSKEVKSLFIPKIEFQENFLKNNAIKEELIKTLCNRITATEERLFSLKNDSVKTRLAKAFKLLLNDVFETGKEITFKFSEEELALLSGTSKKYIKKILEEYQKRNVLKIQNQKCFIYKPYLLING